jgi:hypothetical protein
MPFPDVFLVPMADKEQEEPAVVVSPKAPLSPLAAEFVPIQSDWPMLTASVVADKKPRPTRNTKGKARSLRV